ncbi:MAG: transcriptional regulator TrmB [Candidatus Peregrinibacteria bacterium Gr01-1014_25]|nr:MAG: transcriptional regulator TrmB [Candidatus Peregrinibacteria bacterium Gr01-1014_25]
MYSLAESMISELLKLGLTDEEARVYLACLEINGGPVSLIAKKANTHRVSCYHTLENLLRKNLLSQYNRNGVKCFAPEPPEQLLKLTEEKVHLARGLLPQLQSIASTLAFKPKIRFYEGRDGVERVYGESLELRPEIDAKKQRADHGIVRGAAPAEILGYTNLKTVTTFFPEFFRQYTHERLCRGIKTRYLSPTTVESVHAIDPFLPSRYDANLIEILLVNKEQFPFDNEVLIFGSKVCVVSLNPDELLGLVVESATFARTMKAVFDLAWLGATAFVAK